MRIVVTTIQSSYYVMFKLFPLPESATISLAVNPLLEKAEMSPLRLSVGAGMSLLAVLRLAVVESLLPS